MIAGVLSSLSVRLVWRRHAARHATGVIVPSIRTVVGASIGYGMDSVGLALGLAVVLLFGLELS